MGYYVDVTLEGVFIARENVPGALEALRHLHERGGHLSWVNDGEVLAAIESGCLLSALAEWRYRAEVVERSDLEELGSASSEYKDVEVREFTGQKWGSDEDLWMALAPFVASGAEIEWKGEDGALWKYTFNNGEPLNELHGRIVWE